tara:strand:+ start:31963 stop:34872 length:2910 start_codon:yes stop_codon:yes gene_type:complete
MKRIIYFLPYFFVLNVYAQTVNNSFELRHFSNDPKANGETDFKGENEFMNTEQRIHFLNDYAEYAFGFFNAQNFDQEIVSEKEIDDLLSKLKPQPLTNIRHTIPLNEWKAYGFKKGQDKVKQKVLEKWQSYKGASIVEGDLLLNNGFIYKDLDSLSWRFKFEIKVYLEEKSSCSISLGNDSKEAISLNLKDGTVTVSSDNTAIPIKINNKNWIDLEVEGDFTQKRFNLIVDGEQVLYYIPMADTTIATITQLSLMSKGKVLIDDLFIFNHIPSDNVKVPYSSTVIINEDFEEKPTIEGWQNASFNDNFWEKVDLPSAHGGIIEAGEDYYLRKEISLGDFDRATLDIETVDPGGEIWVNNQIVAVVSNRHPVGLDITRYLKPNSNNLIAIRVKSYKLTYPMPHTPSDDYIGWFLGRTNLLLTNKCMIKDVLANTVSVEDSAIQSHKVHIQYNGRFYFHGSIEINYYPWFPEEKAKVASFNKSIEVRPNVENEYLFEVPIDSPNFWSCDSPKLYKVEVILKDQNGLPVDDYVMTTGVRTLEQKNGDFYVNGIPEMLNGAQILGFRTPIETISKNNRCAPIKTVAEELIMIKKMGANLLRMHVHSQRDTTDGINDPRYAELADQLGVYLIWSTAAWTRTGEAWNIDFKGYPEYMKQVYNHPSIVIWEAANHPNNFKRHDLSDTNDYVKKIVSTITSIDQSRLISPTTFWAHTHYGNYYGTLDYQGNPIQAVPEYMNKLVTRGGQDAYSGYGNEWSEIRNAPNEWAASCLTVKDKAYFNFEHEESAGQPNWDLCKGKPWYLLQSYEWDYDEGSIGRKLSTNEWKASQAWQAFSAWESMKKQILLGYDGFSWCCLHGGPNMGTYQKPLIDNLGYPKLAYYVNKMVFQRTWAGSNNVDVVYGSDDMIVPVINHMGSSEKVDLVVKLESMKGEIIEQKRWNQIELNEGHSITELNGFRFKNVHEGTYAIIYEVIRK